MGIALVICLFSLLGIAFDLGRKWERMEWDGSFDEAEAAQQPYALDGARVAPHCVHGYNGSCPECSAVQTPPRQ
jgi:hypothetical protein